MLRTLFGAAAAAVLLAGCQGLYLDKGNAYPCDFSLGPGVRDEACFPGDVCSVDGVCIKYIYEGPRFEGTPKLPVYGPGTTGSAQLHPLELTTPLSAIAADLPLGRTPLTYVTDDRGVHLLSTGRVAANVEHFPPGAGLVTQAQTYYRESRLLYLADGGLAPEVATPELLLRDATGHLGVGSLLLPGVVPVQSSDGGAIVGALARVLENPPQASGPRRIPGATPIAWTAAELGPITRTPGVGIQPPTFRVLPWLEGTSDVLDIAGLTQPGKAWVLLLTGDALSVLDATDAGVGAAVEAHMDLEPLVAESGQLRTDREGRIVAGVRRTSMGPVATSYDVLTTLQVTIGADGPSFTQPWPDCTPCDPGAHMEVVSPTVRNGGPEVELVCVVGGRKEPLRVVGSVALTQTDACLTEPLDLPRSFSRVNVTASDALVAWDTQTGLRIAGKTGEVWQGETLSTLRPFFLDRVPRDVAPVTVNGKPTLAAITDDSLTIQWTDEFLLGGEVSNGFRRVPSNELGVSDDDLPLGLIHDVSGWGLSNGGSLFKLEFGPRGGATIVGGATLATAAGDPIRASIGGESLTDEQGEPISFFVAADDSLYFVPDPMSGLKEVDAPPVTPVLTPEPGVPIRSLALERTALGTDGVDYARGYLVTSRNVYAWDLGGEPSNWSAMPLKLSAGQPVEVWFDTRLSALARVGYADGQVFTLPSGFQLTYPLPENDGGVAGTVLDYENLGGWPVAYTSSGLYIAQWNLSAEGKLENRFPDGGRNMPMSWQKVTMPDGSEPWLKTFPLRPNKREAAPAKLFVAKDEKDVNGLTPYRLLVFLDDKVLQVATNLRK